jgi:hypothetical protein
MAAKKTAAASKSGSKASKLSPATNAKRNTKAGRAKMSNSSFALPGKQYRIDDAAHARNALARVAQNGTRAQQAAVQKAVAKKYPNINVTGMGKKKS